MTEPQTAAPPKPPKQAPPPERPARATAPATHYVVTADMIGARTANGVQHAALEKGRVVPADELGADLDRYTLAGAIRPATPDEATQTHVRDRDPRRPTSYEALLRSAAASWRRRRPATPS